MKGRFNFGLLQRVAHAAFKLRAKFFEQLPAIGPLQLAQLRQTRRHRQRIARERAGLIDRPIWR